MADHLVDRGADALGKSFVVEISWDCTVLDAIVVHPLVDFLSRRTDANMSCDVIERADVDLGAGLDALNILGRLQQVAREHLEALRC